jgi:hypothetical protein
MAKDVLCHNPPVPPGLPPGLQLSEAVHQSSHQEQHVRQAHPVETSKTGVQPQFLKDFT